MISRKDSCISPSMSVEHTEEGEMTTTGDLERLFDEDLVLTSMMKERQRKL